MVYKDVKINFLDTPGSSDFVGEVILAFRSCESALLALDSKTGVQIETIKLWRNLEGRKKPRMVFASKLDEERASFQNALSDIKEKFKIAPVAITIPMGEGADFKGVVDVLNGVAYPLPSSHDQKEVGHGAVPADMADTVAEYRSKLFEAAAEGDDALMEKYLESGELSQEETLLGLKEAFAAGKVVPAFAGSAIAQLRHRRPPRLPRRDRAEPAAARARARQSDDGKEAEVAVDPSQAGRRHRHQDPDRPVLRPPLLRQGRSPASSRPTSR